MLKHHFEGWAYKDGILHCSGYSLEKLHSDIQKDRNSEHTQKEDVCKSPVTPCYIYCKEILKKNCKSYKNALSKMREGKGILSYAIKANSNPSIIKVVLEYGASMATTVSGNEVLLAMKVGYAPQDIILNGNGKQRWEVELAVRQGIILNVDSLFDAELLIHVVSASANTTARVLLRINPSLDIEDAQTHPYLATALKNSKFGIDLQQLDLVLSLLRSSGRIKVEGVHIHIGSAISQIDIYGHMAKLAMEVMDKIRNKGWYEANIINLGGGLAVENEADFLPRSTSSTERSSIADRDVTSSANATPQQLIDNIQEHLPDNITLILEPGRSLVASAGVVMTEVLGVKTNGGQTFVVVDAAMTEVIRPALYNAVHPVLPITLPPTKSEWMTADVVGPVCESGDFLGRDQKLPVTLTKGSVVVVCKTGAYCSSMASNYNLRPLAGEILVTSQDSYQVIRRPQTLEQILIGCRI